MQREREENAVLSAMPRGSTCSLIGNISRGLVEIKQNANFEYKFIQKTLFSVPIP